MLRGRVIMLGRLACRVVVGTAIYVVIVALATPLPTAAGMMLTFPALNGLAFYFSEDERATSIAKSMFWMPIINGVLCAAYILLFISLARVLPPTLTGWGLLLGAVAIWFGWVSRGYVRAGIGRSGQPIFAIAASIAALALAAITMLVMAHPGLASQAVASGPAGGGSIVGAVAGSKLKIELFALTLAVLVSAIQYFPISDSTRGILGGLPVVPFGGLVSIAGDISLSADARIEIFRGMMTGVWLGPAIAIWYIFFFSRFLAARRKAGARAADALSRFGALLVAWLATFAVIVAFAYVLNAFGDHGTTSQPAA
jgi:hypothetical protein